MKTMQQLLRQPARTTAGILLVALAVSILTIGVGQGIAAIDTREAMDAQFNTVALTTPVNSEREYVFTNRNIFNGTGGPALRTYLPEDILTWMEGVAAEHPELVELDSRPGLAAAHIPELTPDNHTRHDHQTPLESSLDDEAASIVPVPFGAPYTCALLEVTLLSVEEEMSYFLGENGESELRGNGEYIAAAAIDRVHFLPEGYNDPTDWTLYIYLAAPAISIDPDNVDLAAIEQYRADQEALQAYIQTLQPGRRYLVYGTDYYDADWRLRGRIKMEYANRPVGAEEVIIEAFDPEKLVYLSEAEIERNRAADPLHYHVAKYTHGYKTIDLTAQEAAAVRAVYATDPELVPLEGSAEEFLASPEGAQWAEYLEHAQINAHAFPIVGVDKLGYIAPFAQETARVVEGRDFTPEELAGGAKVCVMAQSLAAANGLAVGDTIDLRYYNFDPEAEGQYRISEGFGTTNPTAYFYGEDTPFAGEPEEYTIVGLYRYTGEWGDPQEDLYSFTPNTIFVPKNSVAGTMDYGDQAFFRSIVLENGAIADFAQLVSEAGYEGLFVYYDQGYSEISAAFHDYETAAGRASLIGCLAYGAIFLLFLLLFPARQGKTLATMNSLGADWKRKFTHVVVSALGILIPGTVIGAVTGALLWRRVSDILAESVESIVSVEADAGSILLAAGIQLVFALCLTMLLALSMSANRGLGRRRSRRR